MTAPPENDAIRAFACPNFDAASAVRTFALVAAGLWMFVIPRTELHIRTVYHEGSASVINVNVKLTNLGTVKAERITVRIVVSNATRTFLDETGNVIPAVNLAEDYERLIRERWVTGGMALKLREIEQLMGGSLGPLLCPSRHQSIWRPSSSPTRAVEQ